MSQSRQFRSQKPETRMQNCGHGVLPPRHQDTKVRASDEARCEMSDVRCQKSGAGPQPLTPSPQPLWSAS